MTVVFRADASRVIGHGHIMRSLTLAARLREHGVTVSFVCREHDGHLCDLIEEQKFVVCRLGSSDIGSTTEDTLLHASWLGASWEEDADQTRGAIEALGEIPDWLIVDHYALDRRWEEALRGSVRRIMVIDDLADRLHDCEILLDQNLFVDPHMRYRGKVPAMCGLLLGPQYALLQPMYAELHNHVRPREGPIKRLLIFFGGADNENLTGRALAATLSLHRPDIRVDVVVAANSSHLVALRQEGVDRDNVHVYSGLPTLAPLMVDADLAIGASGVTSWERLCLGLPTLVVTLAENQGPVAHGLSQFNLIRWLGHRDTVSESIIAQALDELFRQGLDEDWSRRCLEVVDGQGVDRVCAVLTAMAGTPLHVRRALPGDEALLLEWANDPITRRNAFSSELISAEIHHDWFRDRLADTTSCHFYLVEIAERIPIGQVRFERMDQSWVISYAIAPCFRGRGLGRPLLEAALLQLREDEPQVMVLGVVKEGNVPSRRVFESLGFDSQMNEGTMEYRRAI